MPRLCHQLTCVFLDGTKLSLTRFDESAENAGHAVAIEASREAMASSHQVKRFFLAFSSGRVFQFRSLLQRLFLWRLEVVEPVVLAEMARRSPGARGTVFHGPNASWPDMSVDDHDGAVVFIAAPTDRHLVYRIRTARPSVLAPGGVRVGDRVRHLFERGEPMEVLLPGGGSGYVGRA